MNLGRSVLFETILRNQHFGYLLVLRFLISGPTKRDLKEALGPTDVGQDLLAGFLKQYGFFFGCSRGAWKQT